MKQKTTDKELVWLTAMNTHDTGTVNENTHVLKVPTGWVYHHWFQDTNGNTVYTSTFVPQ